MSSTLTIDLHSSVPVAAENGGLFLSRGEGIHPKRTIQSYELILVRSGTLSLYEEKREFHVRPGQYLLLWPGREHGGLAEYSIDLSFYWIHFQLKDGSGSGDTHLPQTAQLHKSERLEALFRRFLNDQEEAALKPIEADLLVCLMLCETARAEKAEAPPSKPGSYLARRAMELILTEFTEPETSTATLATEIGCNADYLGRVFRKLYGLTVTEQIQRTRIKEARRLLLDATLNIEEVASRCGFNQTSYFRRIFGSLCGVSPREFRKLHLRIHINTI